MIEELAKRELTKLSPKKRTIKGVGDRILLKHEKRFINQSRTTISSAGCSINATGKCMYLTL